MRLLLTSAAILEVGSGVAASFAVTRWIWGVEMQELLKRRG